MEDLYSFDKVSGYSIGVLTLNEKGGYTAYSAEIYFNGTCVHVGPRRQSGAASRALAIKWVQQALEAEGAPVDDPLFHELSSC